MTEITDPSITTKNTLDGTELAAIQEAAGGAGSGKNAVTQAFTVLTNKYNKVLSFSDYSTIDPKGVSDSAAGLNQANLDAESQNLKLFVPYGNYLVNSTVEVRAQMFGLSYSGNNNFPKAEFNPGMTNGTPCLQMKQPSRHFHVENIAIKHSAVSDPNIATGQAGAPQNCIGLQLGALTGVGIESSWGVLRNIYIHGCDLGAILHGWLNIYSLISFNYCRLGMHAREMNACKNVNLIFENCAKDFIIGQVSNGTKIDSISCEGNFGTQSSTIDDVKGFSIGNYRTEQDVLPRGAPWLTVGENLPCKNFHILNGNFTKCGNRIPLIIIDEVDTWSINANFDSSDESTSVKTTDKAKHELVRMPLVSQGYPTTGFDDFANYPVENYFSNPFLQGVRFGDPDYTEKEVTVVEDTTRFRRGDHSLKVTCTGGNFNRMRVFEKRSYVIDAFQNLNFTFAAWVFIPDIPDYDPLSQTHTPMIRLLTSLAAASRETFSSLPLNIIPGSWNFLIIEARTALSFDLIEFAFYPNAGSAISTTAHFINIAQAVLCRGHVASQIYEGKWVNSPGNTYSTKGNLCTIIDTQANAALIIANTSQTWKAGDTIEYSDPTAGGAMGKRCTTAGTGVSAVWKDLPNLSV